MAIARIKYGVLAIYYIAFYGVSRVAQAKQRHARPRLAAGMRSNSACSNVAVAHQQGGCVTPLSFSSCIAQLFSLPHRGQTAGAPLGNVTGNHCGCRPQSRRSAAAQRGQKSVP